jgi:hypothetical protein
MSDLTASISHALTLATRLRSMSEKIKDGEFKRVLDALLLELAELQLKLDQLVSEYMGLKGQAPGQPAPPAQGDCCPRCGALGWKISATKPTKTAGVIAQIYACGKCGLKEEVLVAGK